MHRRTPDLLVAGSTPEPPPRPTRAALAGFHDAVQALCDTAIADDDATAAQAELAVLVESRRRIDTRICRLTAAVTSATVAQARADDPGDVRAGERAARAMRRELAEDLRLTPSQVQANQRVGARLADAPALAAAMDAGAVTPTHARLLDQTLRHLTGDERRTAETRLVAMAQRLDERAFGRECRRMLARLDHDAAMDEEQRRHRRRRAAVTQTQDGMTVVNGQWTGLQGEIAHTAVHAFRRPDVAGEHRTAEQRTADAVIAAFEAALNGGRAATQHGVRPHIVITADLDSVAARKAPPVELPPAGAASADPQAPPTEAPPAGATSAEQPPAADAAPGRPRPSMRPEKNTADGAWTGPIPWGAVRQILDDSAVSFIMIGDELPIAVTKEVRTVPIGIHRALVLRDRGCIHPRCDHPPQWCDVMHLAEPYRHRGKLKRSNAALGCREHHRQYDDDELTLQWDDGRPVLRPPP